MWMLLFILLVLVALVYAWGWTDYLDGLKGMLGMKHEEPAPMNFMEQPTMQ